MTVTLLDRSPEQPEAADARTSLIGLTRSELMAALAGIGVPERQLRMRANQLWRWIYNRGATSFDAMTDINKDARASLAEHFTLARPEVSVEQVSTDGTRKWLLSWRPTPTAAATRSRPSTFPSRTAAPCASPARSAAR
jgi:23S rRNA (adenine2503-C2)-methyltransferase